jgi:hypothetical protein
MVAGRAYSLCGNGRLLAPGRMKGREQSGDGLASCRCQLIAIRPAGSSGQAVGAKQAPQQPHPAAAPTGVLQVGSGLGEENSLQVAVAKSVQRKLPSAHGWKPGTILGQSGQGPPAACPEIPAGQDPTALP